MDDDCKPWQQSISASVLVWGCILLLGLLIPFAVYGGRHKADRDETEVNFDFPVEGEAKAWINFDERARDLVECKTLIWEKDPVTDSRFFSVDGSPVQGKLKVYLDARLPEGDMPIFKNHPDGESCYWVEMPMPLFLSLTDKSPSP